MNIDSLPSETLLDKIYEITNKKAPKAMVRIATYVVENSEKVSSIPIAELAVCTHTAQSTVVKFCRGLGYSGFREFKDALITEVEREKTRYFIDKRTLETSKYPPKMVQIHGAMQDAILSSIEMLDLSQIRQLAVKIKNAKSVEICGDGVSSICADLLAVRLTWMGLIARSSRSSHLPVGFANTFNSNSVAFGISHGGFGKNALSFVETARKKGAFTVGITTRADNPLASASEEVVLLRSVGPWPEPGSARLVPSIVLFSECLARELKELGV